MNADERWAARRQGETLGVMVEVSCPSRPLFTMYQPNKPLCDKGSGFIRWSGGMSKMNGVWWDGWMLREGMAE